MAYAKPRRPPAGAEPAVRGRVPLLPPLPVHTESQAAPHPPGLSAAARCPQVGPDRRSVAHGDDAHERAERASPRAAVIGWPSGSGGQGGSGGAMGR